MISDIVPIVFACDENYVLQTAVAINSLLINGLKAQESFIYVLTDGKLSKDEVNLFHIIENRFPDCRLEILSVDNNIFSHVSIERLTCTTLYRLLLPEILLQYKRCIYLDADVMILGDISELINVDLDGMYLIGVIDKLVQEDRKHANELALPDLKGYINAGVLVMNLELLREQRKKNQFLSLAKKAYRFADQDILNKSCRGKIRFLSNEYNYFAIYPERDYSVRILHFAGGLLDRPWMNERSRDAAEWWLYAGLFEETPIYQKLCKEVRAMSEGRNFGKVLEWCREHQHIYIWGYTRYSRGLLEALIRNGVYIDGFIDSDPDKQQSIFQGYKVYSPDNVQYNQDCFIINAAQKNRKNVNTFLSKKKLGHNNVFQFYIKPREYFQVLDEKYFDEEFREYILKEYGIRR